MKQLSKVIHPEILLDLRGELEYRTALKATMGMARYEEDMGCWAVHSRLSDLFQRDRNMSAMIFTMKRFLEAKEKKVYYVPKDFAIALSRIDKAIPASILKQGFVAYFELGSGAFSDVQGGYVYIDTALRMGMADRGGKRSTTNELCIIALTVDENGDMARYSGDLRDDFSLKEKLDSSINTPGVWDAGPINSAALQCLINAAIYVHSSDPDIANLIPRREMNSPQREESRNRYNIENMCMLPMVVLNRSFALGRQYSSDTSVVSSHFRWQRHGPGNSLVKLITIEEFVRRNPGHF